MHLFFESVWKLHIGEIPEKPKQWDYESGGDPPIMPAYVDPSYHDALDNYNEAIAAIKQNALTVANPILCPQNMSAVELGKFYEWIGGYETKEIIEYPNEHRSKIVAMLTPPNTLTMKTEPIAIFNPKEITPENYERDMIRAFEETAREVRRAKELFPSMFINQHEAIAVIREEYLELEHECFKNQKRYDLEAQRKEAKQLAAMAIRLMIELT